MSSSSSLVNQQNNRLLNITYRNANEMGKKERDKEKERESTTADEKKVTTYISPYYVRLSNEEFEEKWEKKGEWETDRRTKQKHTLFFFFVDNEAKCVCMLASDALLFAIVKQSLCYCSTKRSQHTECCRILRWLFVTSSF